MKGAENIETHKKYKNGETYNALTIINDDAGRTKGGDRLVECKCLCGKKIKTRCSYLGNGHTKTCGCLNGTKTKKHGMYKSKEYRAWVGINRACHNPKAAHYHKYGGAGITVCDEWRKSFDNFLSDMGLCPSQSHILLRKDVNLDFSSENTYWGNGLERILSRKKWSGTSSRYKGVYWIKSRKKWRSEIKVGDKKHHLGYFHSESDAYRAFCDAHVKFRGCPVQNGDCQDQVTTLTRRIEGNN
ncbi:AP2 domain-containing protein [Pectobacterium brasiliense]|uniref:hypothetical protein n=1 Tax=Pectobacterium brasiliense TaxID=180957 RepID=UPI003985B4FA